MATALALPPDPRIVAAVCPAVAVIEPDHPLRRQGTEFVDNVVDLRRQLREFGADCLYFFGHASHAAPPVPDTTHPLPDTRTPRACPCRPPACPCCHFSRPCWHFRASAVPT